MAIEKLHNQRYLVSYKPRFHYAILFATGQAFIAEK